MSDDSFDAIAKGRTTESGAAIARRQTRHGGSGHGVVARIGLSRRQAYRYLELGRAGASAPLPVENSVTVTLKMPASLARSLREHASKRGMTTSELVRQAVAAFLATKRRHG